MINSAQFDSDIIYSLIVGDSNTSAMDVFNIDSDGNVGIGTESPSALLEVNGNAIISGNLTVSGTLDATKLTGDGSGITDINANYINNGTYINISKS